ncbi:periplasmic binding protein-like II [Leucogyrophana mollusca]|uniref:Periplasmic binding protein-like II n=1 Tax=Leucogyrophana mollusca TaxID=85980 RepID=A0ACB8AZK4_9AGAM|nr:periplasmic binding protein-like II [Leucogyrophana mollusca]
MPLRVGYVREHFCSPLLQFSEVDQGSTFTLVECPSGTGQLISRLTNDEIDIAIALTDPLIAGIAKGSKTYKLVGSYVTSSLKWAVITGKDSPYNNIQDVQGTTIGISRNGSGSQTMAYVMALENKWPTDNLKFRINNDIRGLIDSVNDGSTSAFMWEWFTTKPFVDAGEARFIGAVPTPWPSWLIAAHPTRTTALDVSAFLAGLTKHVKAFASPEARAGPSVDFIKDKFGYPEEDVKAWMKDVSYPDDCAELPSEVLTKTLDVLAQAGVVSIPEGGFDLAEFFDLNVVRLNSAATSV